MNTSRRIPVTQVVPGNWVSFSDSSHPKDYLERVVQVISQGDPKLNTDEVVMVTETGKRYTFPVRSMWGATTVTVDDQQW
jgi:hypothetical protein